VLGGDGGKHTTEQNCSAHVQEGRERKKDQALTVPFKVTLIITQIPSLGSTTSQWCLPGDHAFDRRAFRDIQDPNSSTVLNLILISHLNPAFPV
jgi:hypothetical protein